MNIYCQMAIVALLPAVVLLIYIYQRDKYKKEPVGEILKGVGWGILSIPITLFFSYLISLSGINPFSFNIIQHQVNIAFWGAAIPEEAAKLLVLWLFLRKNKHFDEHVDGIVYAVAVAMGFAAVENMMYVFQNADNWVSVGVMRAIFSVPGHYAVAVFMGYYYSIYRFGKREHRYLYLALAWVVPMVAHGVFDALLYISGVMPSFLSFVVLVLFGVFCYYMHKYARQRIEAHLRRDGVL